MDTNNGLSVVMAAYNAAATIGEQLDALAQQQWAGSWELLVVNNRSTDDTAKIARSFAPRLPALRVIEAGDRQGAAYAMNRGVHAARFDAIAFCDADDVVAPGWVAAMGEALQQHAFVSGPFEVETLNRHSLARYHPNNQPTGVQDYRYPPFFPHCGAGNMGVRRAAFELVGGFDESLAALFDTDFCWKLQLRGVPLTPVPGAVLHVRRRSEIRAMLRQARTYAEYDVALYKRYRPLGMPKLTVRMGISGWLGLVRGASALLDERRRGLYLWMLGWRAGRLYGSIKHRVWAL